MFGLRTDMTMESFFQREMRVILTKLGLARDWVIT